MENKAKEMFSSFENIGISLVGYHGEMDISSREDSYLQWKSNKVQVIVATKAFGMGIDKADIRHIIKLVLPYFIIQLIFLMPMLGS